MHDVKLRDRVGAEHPVKADVGCRNTVFNALAQTGAEYVSRMIELGVRHFRVEFLNETPEQVTQTIAKYRQLLRGEITGTQLWRELKLFNQLGVTRGQMGNKHGIQLGWDNSAAFQAASFKATETRKPRGFKISCNVSRVGLPFLERILYRLGRLSPTRPARLPMPPPASTTSLSAIRKAVLVLFREHLREIFGGIFGIAQPLAQIIFVIFKTHVL